MRRRLTLCTLVAGAALLAVAADAAAQQTLNFSLGYLTVRGEDARVEGDVLNTNSTFLAFDVSDFNTASVGGEWLVPLGEYIEAGAGVSFSRRTVSSVYQDFIDIDGTEIDQDLRLRLVPIDFTVRVLPLGQRNALQPYFGAGLGVINWRYSEFGEFVDFGNNAIIIEDQFVADGNETGPVVVAGLRFGGETLSAGGEIRYRSGSADLDERFAGSKLDLGGWTYNVTFGVRFGR
jgi:hypothetical protein